MTVLDDFTATTHSYRAARRHEIVTTGGMDAVLRVGSALRAAGYAVRDFAVEVHDGVPYGSITCTVSLTSAECDSFARRMSSHADVVAVEPR